MFAEHMQERERKDRDARKAERRRRMDAFRALLEATASVKVRRWQHACLACRHADSFFVACAPYSATFLSREPGLFFVA